MNKLESTSKYLMSTLCLVNKVCRILNSIVAFKEIGLMLYWGSYSFKKKMEQLKNSWKKRKINHVPVESFYSSNQWILSLKWQKDVKTLMGFKSRVIMIIHDWNNGVVVNIRSILFAKKWRWISFYLALLKRILILNSKRFLLCTQEIHCPNTKENW